MSKNREGRIKTYRSPRLRALHQIRSSLELDEEAEQLALRAVSELNTQKARSITRHEGQIGRRKKDLNQEIRREKLSARRREVDEEMKVMRSKENLLTKKELQERKNVAEQNLRTVERALKDDSFDQKFGLLQSRSAILYPLGSDPQSLSAKSQNPKPDGVERIRELQEEKRQRQLWHEEVSRYKEEQDAREKEEQDFYAKRAEAEKEADLARRR